MWGAFHGTDVRWNHNDHHKQKIKQFKNLLPVLRVFFGLESSPGKKKWCKWNKPTKIKSIQFLTYLTLFYYIQLVSMVDKTWLSFQWFGV